MTLTQNKIHAIVGVTILSIGLAYGGNVFASHSFEIGTATGVVPDNTHVRLDGMTLATGDVFPLYDSSPNYVAGHFLLKAPCIPVTDGDDTYKPTVTVVAGHVDEMTDRTHMRKIPLYYINAVSNPPNSCIFHAHIPDPLNGGSPRVTDIDLINLSGSSIEFRAGDVVDINIQRTLGSIGTDKYDMATDGTPVIVSDEHGTYNPVYDLNDNDHTNDGYGHTG
ncbi:MAG: hypothetical protein EB161_09415 [Nitrosopumilaceae archaeon]|nr:hypothetical protein [Nitrosopumilaceae archaeon]